MSLGSPSATLPNWDPLLANFPFSICCARGRGRLLHGAAGQSSSPARPVQAACAGAPGTGLRRPWREGGGLRRPVYVRMCVCTYVRTYVCMYIHTYVHTYVHTCVRTYVRTYIHTYIHTHTHTHIHTHRQTHAKTGKTWIIIKKTTISNPPCPVLPSNVARTRKSRVARVPVRYAPELGPASRKLSV